MPNIKPISDLRNYASVLKEVKAGKPVFLTKNGRGVYAIVDITDQEEYEKAKAYAWLISELKKGEESYKQEGGLSADEIEHFIEDRWNGQED